MVVGKKTDPLHSRAAAISVLPDQILLIEVSPDDHRTPAEELKIEDAVIPNHQGRSARTVFFASQREKNSPFGVIGGLAQRPIGPGVVDNP